MKGLERMNVGSGARRGERSECAKQAGHLVLMFVACCVQVSGPGGYRFLDYTRFGLPLQFIAALITVPICVLYFEGQPK